EAGWSPRVRRQSVVNARRIGDENAGTRLMTNVGVVDLEPVVIDGAVDQAAARRRDLKQAGPPGNRRERERLFTREAGRRTGLKRADSQSRRSLSRRPHHEGGGFAVKQVVVHDIQPLPGRYRMGQARRRGIYAYRTLASPSQALDMRQAVGVLVRRARQAE